MKVRKIDNRVVAVAHAASDDDSRPALCGVHIREDGVVEATNGAILLQSNMPMVDEKELPPNALIGEFVTKSLVVPMDALKQAVKFIPKGKTALEVLKGAYIAGDSIQSTDLSVTHRTKFTPYDGDYPPTETVTKLLQGGSRNVTRMTVKMLEIIVKAAKTAKATQVEFTMCEDMDSVSSEPISITMLNGDGPVVSGVAMPCAATERGEVK